MPADKINSVSKWSAIQSPKCEMIRLNLCGICLSNLVLCSITPGNRTQACRKEQQLGRLVIHQASVSTGETGQRNTHTHSLFVCCDCHLWEYPHQWLNWLQETLFGGTASVPISKESRCAVLPKSQDLFHGHHAQRNRLLFGLVSFWTEWNRMGKERGGLS